MRWLLDHREILPTVLFVLVVSAHSYLLGRWRQMAYESLKRAMQLHCEKECLAQWLRGRGWLVTFESDRVVIQRDPEEERLRRPEARE